MEEACGEVKRAKTIARLQGVTAPGGQREGRAGRKLVQPEVEELGKKQPSYTGLCRP